MTHTVKYIRIIGGKDDGDTQKLEKPWEVDPDEVLAIDCEGETYRLDRIEGETASFVQDGFTNK